MHRAGPRPVQPLYKPGNQLRHSTLVKDSSSLGAEGRHSLLTARAGKSEEAGPSSQIAVGSAPGRGVEWGKACMLSAPHQ